MRWHRAVSGRAVPVHMLVRRPQRYPQLARLVGMLETNPDDRFSLLRRRGGQTRWAGCRAQWGLGLLAGHISHCTRHTLREARGGTHGFSSQSSASPPLEARSCRRWRCARVWRCDLSAARSPTAPAPPAAARPL